MHQGEQEQQKEKEDLLRKKKRKRKPRLKEVLKESQGRKEATEIKSKVKTEGRDDESRSS